MAEPEGEVTTVIVAVKERLHPLKWTIENIIQESSSWPWKSNGKINLVVVRSAHVPPRMLACCFTSSPPYESNLCTSSSIRKELEKSCAKNTIEAAEKECQKRNIEVKTVETKGDPRVKVFQLVKELKADILVLGGHSYSGMRKCCLGSVEGSHVHYAKAHGVSCHIVVVHQKRGTPYFVSIHHAEKET